MGMHSKLPVFSLLMERFISPVWDFSWGACHSSCMMEQFASSWWKSLFSLHFFPFLLLLSCHSLLDLVAPGRGFTKSLAYLFRQQHAQALTSSRNGPSGWRDFMLQDVKFNADSLKLAIIQVKKPMLSCLLLQKPVICEVYTVCHRLVSCLG